MPDFQLSPRKGFTLIELMVAISIVAILATIGLVIYSQAQNTARDAKTKEEVENIKKAMYLGQAQFGDFCLGAGTAAGGNCSAGLVSAMWVNGSYGAPTDTLLNNLKANLKHKTAFNPQIGLYNVKQGSFTIVTTIKSPPADQTTCNAVEAVVGAAFGDINYCLTIE